MQEQETTKVLDPLTGLVRERKSPQEMLRSSLQSSAKFDTRAKEVFGTFGDYGDLSVTSESNFNELRARNQGGFELLLKSAVQTATTIGGLVLEGSGYLLDIPRSAVNSVFESADLFERNFLSEAGRVVQEFGQDVAPIYQTEKAQSSTFGRFGDRTFIAQSMPSIFSSIGMMIPGAGVAAGLSRVARAARLSNSLAKGVTSLGTALANTHMDNMATSTMYFDENRKRLMDEGYSEKESNEMAAAGSAQLYKGAFVTNMLLNSVQWRSILKPYDFANRNMKSSIGNILDDKTTPFLSKVKQVLKENPNISIKSAAQKADNNIFLQAVSEGLEEFNIEFATHLANRNMMSIEAGRPDEVRGILDSYFSSDLIKVAADPRAQDAFLFGMIGGAGFAAAGSYVSKEQKRKIQEEGVRQAQMFERKAEFIRNNIKKQMEAVAEGDEIKSEEARFQSIQNMAINGFVDPLTKNRFVGSAESGTIGADIEIYDAVQQLTDEEISQLGLGEDGNKVRESAKFASDELNRIKDIYNKLADKNFGTERDDVVRAYTAEQEYINDYTKRVISKYEAKIQDLKEDQRYKSSVDGFTDTEILYSGKKRKVDQLQKVKKGLIEIQEKASKKIEKYGYLYAANSAIPERSIRRTIDKLNEDISILESDIKGYEGVDGPITKSSIEKVDKLNKSLSSDFSELVTNEIKKISREYKLVEGEAFLNEFYKQPNLKEFVRNVQRGEEELKKTLYRFSIDENIKNFGFVSINKSFYRAEKDGDGYRLKLVDRELRDVPGVDLSDSQKAVARELDRQLKREKESLEEKDGVWISKVESVDDSKLSESIQKIDKIQEERKKKILDLVRGEKEEGSENLSEDIRKVNLEYDKKIKDIEQSFGKKTKEVKLSSRTRKEAEKELDDISDSRKKKLLPSEYFSKKELFYKTTDELIDLSDSEFFRPNVILSKEQFDKIRNDVKTALSENRYNDAARIIQDNLYRSNYYDKSVPLLEDLITDLTEEIDNVNSINDLSNIVKNAQGILNLEIIGDELSKQVIIKRERLQVERRNQLAAFNKIIEKKEKNLVQISKKLALFRENISSLYDVEEMSYNDIVNSSSDLTQVIEALEAFKSFVSDGKTKVKDIIADVNKEIERLSEVESEIKKSLDSFSELKKKFEGEIPTIVLESDLSKLNKELERLRVLSLYEFSVTEKSLRNLERRVKMARENMSSTNVAARILLKKIQNIEGATEESILAARRAFKILQKEGKLNNESSTMIEPVLRRFIFLYNSEISELIKKEENYERAAELERLKVLEKNELTNQIISEDLGVESYLDLLEEVVANARELLYAADNYNNFYSAIKSMSTKLSMEDSSDIDSSGTFSPRRHPTEVFSVLSGNYGSVEYGLTSDEAQARYGRWITNTNISSTDKVYKIKVVRPSDVGIQVPEDVLKQYEGKEQYILFALVVDENGNYYTEAGKTTESFDPDVNVYTSMPQPSYFVGNQPKTYAIAPRESEEDPIIFTLTDSQLKKLYPPQGNEYNPETAKALLRADMKKKLEEHVDLLEAINKSLDNGEEVILDVKGKTNGVQAEDPTMNMDTAPSLEEFFGSRSKTLILHVPTSNSFQIGGQEYSVIPGLPIFEDQVTGNLFRAYTRYINDEEVDTIINSLAQVAKLVKLVTEEKKNKQGKKYKSSRYSIKGGASKQFLNVVKDTVWFSKRMQDGSKARFGMKFSKTGRRRPQIVIDGKTYDLAEINRNDGSVTGRLNPRLEQALREYLPGQRLNINTNREGKTSVNDPFVKRLVDKKGKIKETQYPGGYAEYLIKTNSAKIKQRKSQKIEKVIEVDGIEKLVSADTVTHYSQNLVFINEGAVEKKPESTITQKQLREIIDSGEIPDEILQSIKNKIENKLPISPREREIAKMFGLDLPKTETVTISSTKTKEGTTTPSKTAPTVTDTETESKLNKIFPGDLEGYRSGQKRSTVESFIELYDLSTQVGFTEKDIRIEIKKRIESLKDEGKLNVSNPSEAADFIVSNYEKIRKVYYSSGDTSGSPETTETQSEVNQSIEDAMRQIAEETGESGYVEEIDSLEEDRDSKKASEDISNIDDEFFQKTKYGREITKPELQSQIDVISRRINVPIKVVTVEEGLSIIEQITGKRPTEKVYGFERNGIAYVMGDNTYNGDTLFHEVAHPIISDILKNNRDLFYSLFEEIESTPQGKKILEEVKKKYSSLNKGYLEGTYSIPMMSEIIVTAIGKDAADLIYGNANKTLKQKIAEIWDAILDYFRIKLGMKVTPAQLNKRSTVRDLARLIATRKVDVSVQRVSDNVLNLQKGEQTIKEGVPELFESNPELANDVYEALGFFVMSEVQVSNKIFNPDMAPDGYSKIITVNGKNIGEFALYDYKNETRLSGSLGARTEIDKEYRGKGYGYKAYLELAKQVKADGKVLVSDTDQTEAAIRVWNKLVKEGYANKINRKVDGLGDLYENVYIIDNSKLENINLNPQQKQQAQQLYSQYLDTIFPDSKVKDIVYHGAKTKFDKFDLSRSGENLAAWEEIKKSINFTNKYSIADTYSKAFTTGENTLELVIVDFEENPGRINPDGKTINRKYVEEEILKGNPSKTRKAFKKDSQGNFILDDKGQKQWDEERKYTKKEWEEIIDRTVAFHQKYLDMLNNIGPNVITAIVNIKNPTIIDYSGKVKDAVFYKILNESKGDGFIAKDLDDWGVGDNIRVFEPKQIHILGSRKDIEGFKEFVKSEAPITPTPEVNLETLGVTQSEWNSLTQEEKDMIQQQHKICK